MPDPSVKETWSVEFAEQKKDLEEMTFATDIKALEFIANVRALGDPQIVPTALVKTTTKTMVERIAYPLDAGVDIAKLVEAVTQRLAQHVRDQDGQIPRGTEAIAFAVKATLEELQA